MQKILPEHLHTTVYFIDLFIAKRYEKMACFSNGNELEVYAEAVVQRCSVKKVFSEISKNSHENTCARDSFLITLQAQACNFIKKEFLAQVFSCEFCEISKNTFFKENL